MAWQKIVVLDFNSQQAHKITKTLRLLGYHSEIKPPSTTIESLKGATGIILSDGPGLGFTETKIQFNEEILSLEIPILGIGYGHQLLVHLYGGVVGKALIGEFGTAQLHQDISTYSPLLLDVEETTTVAMAHQEEVLELPQGFEVVASTKVCKYAAVQDLNQGRFGFQCNIAANETEYGKEILENFVRFCGMEKNWDQDIVLELMLAKIRFTAKDKNVLIFLSGGVDSTVAFTLLNKSLGQKRVLGIHIDNGFLRKNESRAIATRYRDFGFTNFVVANASESFLKVMGKETNPKKKRLLEAAYFRHVRNKMMGKLGLHEDEWLVAINTLYSENRSYIDSSEALSSPTPTSFGVQALIDKGAVLEPLKELYRDEVRELGRKMGLQDEMAHRHPFPEPGLAINVLCSTGELTYQKEGQLAQTQVKLLNLINKEGMQATSVTMLPVKAAGIKNGKQIFGFPVALTFDTTGPRNWLTLLQATENQLDPEATELPEEKKDAPWYHIPRWRVLERVSSFITDSLPEVSRVVVKLYQRPNTDLRLQEGYCCKDRLDQTREADFIVLDELKRFGWYEEIFQHLTINLPYASTPQHCSIVLRPVDSEDVITGKFSHMHHLFLDAIMERLVQLPFVDAVYYDITDKPPAKFGWE